MISRKILLDLFNIDLDAGILLWKCPSKYHPDLLGKEAGSPREGKVGKFYWVIQINGKVYRRSHLIFFLAHRRWPFPLADHKNRNSLDDRQLNLRDATQNENAWNHGTYRRRIQLPMGVRATANPNRYAARISYNGRQLHLGAYDTPEQAHQIYLTKRKELHREFS